MDLIVAADKNWGIGNKGGLLCHLPGDMRFFKAVTTGGVVVMGRATLESFPKKKGLPDRINLVLTRDLSWSAEGVTAVHSLKELEEELEKYPEKPVHIIGGESIYRALYKRCSVCFVTRIDKTFEADRHIADLDRDPDFQLAEESPEQEENGIRYRFVKYIRKGNREKR